VWGGGGWGVCGGRVGRQHGRRLLRSKHPRGHRGGIKTPAVVRGGGIGAAPAAAAPTAVTPPARRERQRRGRGAVGALGDAALRRHG